MLKATDPCGVEESSGDNNTEWQPQSGTAASESSDSESAEDTMDLEGDEPDTTVKNKKKGGKKQKRGVTMRDRINKAAAELSGSDNADPNPDVQKRKAGLGPDSDLDAT
jgi:hypothetical protein